MTIADSVARAADAADDFVIGNDFLKTMNRFN
jgi:PTH1 family peptidyl-tRNA hydrolase